MLLHRKLPLYSALFFFHVLAVCASPSLAQALECPAGGREATAADIAVMGPVIKGRCVDAATIATLKPDETYAAIQYLSTKLCAGKQFGLPEGFNEKSTDPKEWYKIKEGYVYFNYTTQTDGRAGTNPGVLRCFANFFQEAEKKGYQPCINAGLRSPAHQRASCLDRTNSVVCGRQVSCTTDLNWYATWCPHVKGLAFDINDRSCGKTTCPRTYALLKAAEDSKIFSKVGAGDTDPWHVEASGCATGGLSSPAPFPTAPTPTPAPARPTVPSNPLTEAARALLGGNTECQQLGAQCKGTPMNPQACMAYAQRCQGQTQNPNLLQALQNAFTQQSASAPTAPLPMTPSTPPPLAPQITNPLPEPETTLPATTTAPATTTHPLSTTTVIELATTQVHLVPPPMPIDPTATLPTTVTPVQPNSVHPTFAPASERAVVIQENSKNLLALITTARTILENLLNYLTPFARMRTAARTSDVSTSTSTTDTALWYDAEFIRYMETQPDFSLGD